ncbi:ionotropic receptor 25a-like [Tubulanus polymorphus]|uniref:ionotropic receptor 25a-like n=1 Tax=Tubulanus polymorphus TaxID=672921 RepID=UPI003DA55EF5
MVVLHDKSFETGILIPNESNERIIESIIFRIPSERSRIRDLLSSVVNQTTSSNFLILAEAPVIDQVLSEAWSLNMMTSLYHWFMASRDLQPITCSSCHYGSVVHVHPVIADWPIYNNLQNLTNGDVKLDIIYAFHAIGVISRGIDEMKGLAQWNDNVYSLNCRTVNHYQSSERFNAFKTVIKNPTSTFDGILGKVDFLGTVNNQFAELQVDRVDFGIKNKTTKKYSMDVLKELSNRLQFDYDIYEPNDGQFGARRPDGSWTGLIGELVSGTAELAVTSLSVTSEREEVVDFSIPYYEFAGIQILMSKRKEDSNLLKFLTVFTWEVWLCNVAVLTAVSFLVYTFDKFSPFSYQNRRDDYPEGGKVFTLKESFWFVMGSYTAAGECYAPRASSARLLVAGFWFFSTIMMSMYTANLAAFNTVSRLSVTVNSLEDLTKQSIIKYTTLDGTSMQTYFKKMAEIESNFYDMWKEISLRKEATASELAKYAVWEYPLGEKYTDIWKVMNRTGFVKSSEEGMRLVKESKGKFAFLTESPIVKYAVSKSCDLLHIGEAFSSKPYGIAMKENSPLVKQVNQVILTLQKERILETTKTYWWNRERVSCPTENTSTGVTMASLGGVFIFMAIGLAGGVLALVIEVLIYRYKTRRRDTMARMVLSKFKTMRGPLEQVGAEGNLVRSTTPRVNLATIAVKRPMDDERPNERISAWSRIEINN